MCIERKNMKISKKNKHFPMPKDLWREAQWQLLIEIVVTILSDVATFTIQLSKSQMQLGRVTVALTILLLYYVSDVFFTALSNVQNEKDLIIEERGKIEAAEIVTCRFVKHMSHFTTNYCSINTFCDLQALHPNKL